MRLTDKQRQTTLDNIGLAHYAANKFNINYYYDHEEVVAISYYGLVLAVLGFNPEKGVKFSTYAVKSIKRTLCRELTYRYKTQIYDPAYLEDGALNIDGEDSNWESYIGNGSPEEELTGKLSAERLIQKINRENKGKGKAKTRAVVNLLYFYPYLTQTELANIVGCSQKNVSLILRSIREKYRQELAV
jgi:RNA polymerase sporulation-specific sigma factor